MKHGGPNLRKEDYRVIDNYPISDLLDLVQRHHYTRSGSKAAVFRFGLERIKDNRVLGVALFMAQRKSTAKSMWHGDHKRVLCLSRLAIDPEVPRNGASFLLGRCIRYIQATGDYDCLITHADTREGHTGQIYRATNWEYMGLTPARPRWENDSGKVASRKQGRRWRTPEEMNALGYRLVGNVVKHKFRIIL